MAIIPDGNRRWAVANKLQTFLGHRKGKDSVKAAITVCIKNNIKHLSIYTFSLENFNRGEEEKRYLFSMLSQELDQMLPEIMKEGVRIRFIGDASYFPEATKDIIFKTQEETKNNNTLNLDLFFCYGSKQELSSAVRELAKQVKDGKLSIDDINETTINDFLWTTNIPDPELIIRTGGAIRLSNFLLYQAAYSEFKFLDCFWPEVTEKLLQQCVDEFKDIKRNFGS
jgi:undecaprenyl diphosphate synthase